MPDLPDLDTRIRDLVHRAVADAPAPPEIGGGAVPPLDHAAPDRRRRWIGATAGLLAAAAAIVTVVLVTEHDDASITPATVPTTVAPEPTTVASGPVTTVATTPEPTSPPPTTASPPSTFVTPQPGTAGLLTAGPDGVRERIGQTVRTVTTEPVVMALDAGDGRVIAQRHDGDVSGSPPTWTDADTVPLVVAADGSLAPLFPDLDWGGGVVLHDVEVVDGRRLLLYSVVVGPITFDRGQEDLWVIDLATGERTSIAPAIGGWEYGTGRLHLASTGLVVGAASGGPTTRPTLFAVPGSTAAAAGGPDPAALLLPSSDCVDCAHAFTVSADGTRVAWVTPGGEVSGVTIADGRALDEPHRFGPAPSGSVSDLELTADGIIASFVGPYGGLAPTPVAVTWDGTTTTTLDGTVATMSPGTPATPPVAAPPTTTSSTSTPPVAPTAVMMVTAGPDGVAVLEGGVEVRRLDQPAVRALLTPGGAVIFQTPPTTPDGPLGDPQIWRPDGTVAPFLGPLAANQWYRLHDVAQIEGVPTVLYGVLTTGTPAAPESYTEAVKALRLDPAGWVTDDIGQINTWEGGYSRLSLSDQGLIIGTAGQEVTTSFFGAVVPRSPAAGQGDPMTPPEGVEPRYSECDDCPDRFAISADGTSLVWTQGSELVVVDTATGERRSWTVPSLGPGTFAELDVRTSADGGVEVAMSFSWSDDTDGPSAVVAATSPTGEVVETDTGARAATFGP